MTYQRFMIMFEFFQLHCSSFKLGWKKFYLETSLVKNVLVKFLDQENVLRDNEGFQTWLR